MECPAPAAPGLADVVCGAECPRAEWWFGHLLQRLLENSPPVVDLFERNPFPDEPPRYVRALLYDYHFTDAAQRGETGDWWRRELMGVYYPIVSLKK